jgi:hypothetical protein
MSAIRSFLNEHVDLLSARDVHFQAYWSKLSDEERRLFWKLAGDIDSCGSGEGNIMAGHVNASRRLARFMVRIQEVPFNYCRLPKDWDDFVHSASEKKRLFEETVGILEWFIRKELPGAGVRLYGNIKMEDSLMRRMLLPKTGDQFRRRLLDTWDVVRFRMVAPDLLVARHTALRVWEVFFEKVVRCRNYYFMPKDGEHSDPYRGVHFELEPMEGRIVELQVLTHARELVSFLDHASFFKKSIQLPSAEHEAWLFFFSRKANLLDLQLIPNEQEGRL